MVAVAVAAALVVGSPVAAQEPGPVDPPSQEVGGGLPEVPPIVSGDPPPNAGPLSPPVEPATPASPPSELDRALVEAREPGVGSVRSFV